jgi:hypothetical protein
MGDLVSSSSPGTMMPPVLAGAATTAGNTLTRLRARTFGRKRSLSDSGSVASAGDVGRNGEVRNPKETSPRNKRSSLTPVRSARPKVSSNHSPTTGTLRD